MSAPEGSVAGLVGWYLSPSGLLFGAAMVAACAAVIGVPGARWPGLLAIAGGVIFVPYRSLRDQRRTDERIAAVVERFDDRLASERIDRERQRDDLRDTLRQELGHIRRRLDADAARIEQSDHRFERLEQSAAALEARQAEVSELTRAATVYLRGRVDALSEHLAPTLPPVAVRSDTTPVLTIAIPSYNRPDELASCLATVSDQMAGLPVEVLVTDDASTQGRARRVAHDFAVEHPNAAFRPLAVNVGLDRNLLECARGARGEYLLLLGNDDGLLPGVLPMLLELLTDDAPSVLLFDKQRVDAHTGAPIPDIAGSRPADIGPDQSVDFESPLAVGRATGLISAFGFISQVVVRREPFLAVDPTPYHGLTMYPQLGVLLEAFGHSPVRYRNTRLSLHRTAPPAYKLAEAIGRSEERFMRTGPERLQGYLGTSLAAMLQRVVDRTDLVPADFAGIPERLLRQESLLGMIRHNHRRGLEDGRVHPDDVTADALRFLAAIEGLV